MKKLIIVVLIMIMVIGLNTEAFATDEEILEKVETNDVETILVQPQEATTRSIDLGDYFVNFDLDWTRSSKGTIWFDMEQWTAPAVVHQRMWCSGVMSTNVTGHLETVGSDTAYYCSSMTLEGTHKNGTHGSGNVQFVGYLTAFAETYRYTKVESDPY